MTLSSLTGPTPLSFFLSLSLFFKAFHFRGRRRLTIKTRVDLVELSCDFNGKKGVCHELHDFKSFPETALPRSTEWYASPSDFTARTVLYYYSQKVTVCALDPGFSHCFPGPEEENILGAARGCRARPGSQLEANSSWALSLLPVALFLTFSMGQDFQFT